MNFFEKLGDSFGSSWFGVLFNPVGYMAGRKSVSEAADDYYHGHPPGQFLGPIEALSQTAVDTARVNWITSCSSQMKSDDVGKSKANCDAACQARWDNDVDIIAIQQDLVQQGIDEQTDLKARTTKNLKNILLLVGIFLFTAVLLYLFFSKSKK